MNLLTTAFLALTLAGGQQTWMYSYTVRAAYDGSRILGADYKTANLWDAKTGDLLYRLKQTDEDLGSVAFSLDGKFAATGPGMGGDIPSRHDNCVRVWDLQTGKMYQRIELTGNDFQFSPDGRQLLINSTWLWDIDARRFRFVFPGNHAQFSQDGSKILVGEYKQIVVWDLKTLKQLCRIECPFSRYFFDSLELSKDGRHCLTACSDFVVRSWDCLTGDLLHEYRGHTTFLMGAGFISNDRKVACPSMDGKILEWDALSGRVTREIKCRGPVEVVLLSPDGSRCLAACGEGVSLIDLDTGKELGRYDRFVPESEAAFAPDSKTFLILKDTAQIYDAGTGALVRKLEYKKS